MRETTISSILIGAIAIGVVLAAVRMGHSAASTGQPLPNAKPLPNQQQSAPQLANLTAQSALLPLQMNNFQKQWEQARGSLYIANLAVQKEPSVNHGTDMDDFHLQLTPDLYLHGNIEHSSERIIDLNLVDEKTQVPQNQQDEWHALEILTRMVYPTFPDQDVVDFVQSLHQSPSKQGEAQGVRFTLKRSEQIDEIKIEGFVDPASLPMQTKKTTSS